MLSCSDSRMKPQGYQAQRSKRNMQNHPRHRKTTCLHGVLPNHQHVPAETPQAHYCCGQLSHACYSGSLVQAPFPCTAFSPTFMGFSGIGRAPSFLSSYFKLCLKKGGRGKPRCASGRTRSADKPAWGKCAVAAFHFGSPCLGGGQGELAGGTCWWHRDSRWYASAVPSRSPRSLALRD